jgi:hypothetical protein
MGKVLNGSFKPYLCPQPEELVQEILQVLQQPFLGGPHVLMWMVAFLGASTASIEGLWHKFIKKAFRTVLVEGQRFRKSDQE